MAAVVGQKQLQVLCVHKPRVVHADDGEVVQPRPQLPGVRHVLVGAAMVGAVHATDVANILPGRVELDGDAPQGVWGIRSQQLDLDGT